LIDQHFQLNEGEERCNCEGRVRDFEKKMEKLMLGMDKI